MVVTSIAITEADLRLIVSIYVQISARTPTDLKYLKRFNTRIARFVISVHKTTFRTALKNTFII